MSALTTYLVGRSGLLRPSLDRDHSQRRQPVAPRAEDLSRKARQPHRAGGDPYFREVSVALGGHPSGPAQPAIWTLPHQSIQNLAGRGRCKCNFVRQLCPAKSHKRKRRSGLNRASGRGLLFDRNHGSHGAPRRPRRPAASFCRWNSDRVGRDVSSSGRAAWRSSTASLRKCWRRHLSS